MKNIVPMSALLLAAALSVPPMSSQAADVGYRGTLIVPPPCEINDGNRVDVDFGNRVGINKVDGDNYRQPINYQISCESGSNGVWAMTLSLGAAATGFDKEALSTSKTDLGIRIYQNGKAFTPGSTLAIDQANPPRLEAVPVKKAGATLVEGAFEAWATLRADYR